MTQDKILPPFVVAIPARFSSTRLPGKPLKDLAGKPLICRVVDQALAASPTQVVVATDDARIARVVEQNESRATVCMTRADHASGSDRLAECARTLGWDDDTIVVNLQGDEPFAPIEGIRQVVRTLFQEKTPMATLCTAIDDAETVFEPSVVKVVTSQAGRALYFSRAPVPWARDAFTRSTRQLPGYAGWYRHIGIYAYRAGFLKQFAMLPGTPLEKTESLEQLRALEQGYAIAVSKTPAPFPPGIDTPEDLAKANAWLKR